MGLINDMKNGKIAPANPVRSVAIPTSNNNPLLQITSGIQTSSNGIGFGFNPITAADKRTPLDPVNANPDAGNKMAYVGGKFWSGVVNSAKGLVNEIGYLGQSAAQGAYARDAAESKVKDIQKSGDTYTNVPSNITKNMQESAKKLSDQPLESYVNWGKNNDNQLNQFAMAGGFDKNKAIKIAGNVSEGVGGMVPSMVSNVIVPGSGLYVMATGAAGNATDQALKGGADNGTALAYGVAVGVTEAATEKLFNGVAGVFGKGAADDVIKSVAKRVSQNESTQKAVMTLANTLGEGFEEWLTEYAEAYENKLLINQDSRNLKQISQDALYSGMIGSLTSVVMQSGNVLNISAKDAGEMAANDALAQLSAQQSAQSPTIASTPQILTDTANVQNASTAHQTALDYGIQANNSTGAAPKNFATESDNLSETYQNAIDTYGAMPERVNLSRQMDVPQSVSDGTVIPQTVQTIMGSEITPSDFAGQMTDTVAQGQYSRAVYDDATAVSNAESVIRDKGYQQALADWTADVKGGKVSKDITAMGITLYNNAVNTGDYKAASYIVADMIDNYRSIGQAMQAINLFNKLTPEGQLYSIQRSVQNLSNELSTKFANKGFKEIEVNDALVKEFLEAPNEEARAAALEKIKDDVASQVPSTWYDKWNAWRYLAMLGNPRTHIRNIVGNAGFAPVRGVKNVIASGLERVSGIDNKTKSILTMKDKPLIKEAGKFYDADEDVILSLGKFDNLTGDINERRAIFKNPLLEVLRKGNTNLLNKEDTWFTRPSYTNALAGWFKANGIAAEDLSGGKVSQETLAKAREYAVRESQRATYRDANAFSDMISQIGFKNTGNNVFKKGVNTVVDSILPFKRTPANILARSVEYSPVGLVKGLTYDLYKVKTGNMEAWQMIDNLSAGLTGSGIVVLGIWLTSMGLISGGSSDDDKEKALDTLTGTQPYSLNVGGKSITLDWLAPEALPFFVGVELYNTFTDNSDNGVGLTKALNNFSNIAEPMLNMSMLQGVEDMLSSIKYADGNNVTSIAATSAVNYLSQGLPTIFGQVERTFEPKRETTYIDKGNSTPTAVQYMLGKIGNKIPGVEYQQRTYTDAFGREQSNGNPLIRALNNFANPAYVSELKNDEVTDELYRLNDGNYMQSAPDLPKNSFDYGGKQYNLTADEYTEYSKNAGKLTHDYMQTMIDSKAYDKMTPEEQAEALSNVMSYANDMAKAQYIQSKGNAYTPPDIYSGARKADDAGINPTDYYIYKSALNEIDTDDSPTQVEITKAIEETDLNNKNKGLLWQLQNSDSNPDKNPYTGSLAQKGLPPEKAIDIMEGYSMIDKAMDNYVKQEGGASAAHIQAAYFKQWLAKQGYNSAQIAAITDVFKTWQMIPVDKPSKKAVAFVTANPIP